MRDLQNQVASVRVAADTAQAQAAGCGQRMGGMSADTVRAHIAAGTLRALVVSRPGAGRPRYRVAAEWVEAWLAENTINAAS